METFDIVVQMTSGKLLEIQGVNQYIINAENGIFEIHKNGYRQFFNKDYVEFIGRASDLAGSCPEIPEV